MYVDEIKYFINCVRNNKKCMNDFKEAYSLLKHII